MVYPFTLLRTWRINMLSKFYKIRVFFLLIVAFSLCQCTKAINPTETIVGIKKKTIATPYVLPVATYLTKANQQQGNEQQKFLLLAAGRLIGEGQWQKALTILTQAHDLTAVQLNEKKVLLAQIDLMRERPKAALTQLATISEPNNFSPYHQIQFHELLAQSYRSLGNYVGSVSERIKLEPLLIENKEQLNNRRLLWLTLINLPAAELSTLNAETSSQSELQAWVELALISQKYRDNSKSLLTALDEWQSRFSKHPANSILPSPLDSIAPKMLARPKQVALLLPLTGALSGPGNAVREGFMAAYKAANDNQIQIKSYDTDKGDIGAIYQTALSNGTDYVVGPLIKSQVATIATMEHPVPTLLLNDVDGELQDNSYLFGLSPTNEATQVAIRARKRGFHRALIIAPQNSWGNDVTKVFINQWQKKGGQVIDTFLYGLNDDLNKKMQDFLQITNSQVREKKLKQLLGEQLQTIPSRRQDFDMVFLLAYPSKARQIMPLLRYYYAGDVPVYATSSVYGGNANALKDKDLDGIIFCDIPWVFAHQMGSRNWPEQFNSYNRLYALGRDSFALAAQLNQLILFPADGSRASNGTLYLKPSREVARVLEWGQFRQGLAHSLDETV